MVMLLLFFFLLLHTHGVAAADGDESQNENIAGERSVWRRRIDGGNVAAMVVACTILFLLLATWVNGKGDGVVQNEVDWLPRTWAAHVGDINHPFRTDF